MGLPEEQKDKSQQMIQSWSEVLEVHEIECMREKCLKRTELSELSMHYLNLEN